MDKIINLEYNQHIVKNGKKDQPKVTVEIFDIIHGGILIPDPYTKLYQVLFKCGWIFTIVWIMSYTKGIYGSSTSRW